MLAGAVHRACVLRARAPAPPSAGLAPEEAEARIVADDKLVALMGVMLALLPTLMRARAARGAEPFGGLDGGWRWLARALNALDAAQTLEQCSAIVAFLEARAARARARCSPTRAARAFRR